MYVLFQKLNMFRFSIFCYDFVTEFLFVDFVISFVPLVYCLHFLSFRCYVTFIL